MDLKEYNPLTLAFIGDAVHTLYVREHFIMISNEPAGKLHLKASKLCSAKAQCKALDDIFDMLSLKEKDIVRRARNTKGHKAPKSANLEEYKKATSFEALIGWLYLQGEMKRMMEILVKTIPQENIKDNKEENNDNI